MPVEGYISLFPFCVHLIPPPILGTRAGPPKSNSLQMPDPAFGVVDQRGPPREPAAHFTQVPSGSSPLSPMTCLRNWVLPTSPGPRCGGAGQ